MDQHVIEPSSGGVITFVISLHGEIYFQFPKLKTCTRPKTHPLPYSKLLLLEICHNIKS